MVIYNSSSHSHSHKLASFRYIHKLINTPLSHPDHITVFNFIKQIAFNNGYNVSLIDKMIKQKLLNQAHKLAYPQIIKKPLRFHVLTYIGKTTDTLYKYFKHLNINIDSRKTNSLGKHIKNNKCKTAKDQKSGVYQLSCGSCDKVYIGQTGRTFKKRLKDHTGSFRNKNGKSNYANHLIEENRRFYPDFKIFNIADKASYLNA